jgi:hypothetical protein
MRYLYIEKRHPDIILKNPWPMRAMRMAQEFEAKGLEYDLSYIDNFSIDFVDGETIIKFAGKDLKEFTHIIFGGHQNGNEWDYKTKVIVAEYVKKYNEEITDNSKKIHLQNQEFILNMPYYDKIHMGLLATQYDLPYLNSYYRKDGDYLNKTEELSGYPTISKHALGTNDRLKGDDGKMRTKKNVFLVEEKSGWDQDRLKDKDKSEFFIQEFSPAAEDYRIFVSKGKVVGGWKRISLDDSFMTVGGDRKYVLYNSPSPEIIEICEKAASVWGVDFMALDFIYRDGKPVILEYSMHPGFKAYEEKCEAGETEMDKEPINVAKTIIESF